MKIYLDIETIPSQDAGLLAKFRAEVTPPSTFKKPESIAEWMAENADTVAKERMAKTSFDPAYGHICAIGHAQNDKPVQMEYAARVDQEKTIIQDFFATIQSETWVAPMFIGHNVSFDIRFLLCRAVVLGVRIPVRFPRDPKPWDKGVFDTMTAWAGARGTISMDNLAKAFGMDGKGDFDGSMVADAWLRGDDDTICKYCIADVERTREIHRMFERVGF